MCWEARSIFLLILISAPNKLQTAFILFICSMAYCLHPQTAALDQPFGSCLLNISRERFWWARNVPGCCCRAAGGGEDEKPRRGAGGCFSRLWVLVVFGGTRRVRDRSTCPPSISVGQKYWVLSSCKLLDNSFISVAVYHWKGKYISPLDVNCFYQVKV